MSTDQATETTTGATGEIMLFGVRVVVDSMRKSVSLNNLSQYEHRLDLLNIEKEKEKEKEKYMAVTDYASADDVIAHHSTTTTTGNATSGSRERKRGVPWTEEEHKLFLLGLQKVGKGDWRGISRNFVKTRTPTQVASHAQKYFLRRSNLNRRRRRSSLFDITTDTVPANDENNGGSSSQSPQPQAVTSMAVSSEVSNVRFSSTVPETTPIYSMTFNNINQAQMINNNNNNNNTEMNKLVRPLPVLRKSSMADFDLNNNDNSLMDPSLKLSLSMSSSDLMANHSSSSSSRHSAFQVLQGFGNNNGDSIISVA